MPGATRIPLTKSARQILIIAIAYAVAGRLALLLAIPPGYATAVWPAAGVAFAAVLICGPHIWPGIVAGSFLVNIGTSFDASTGASLARSLAIALSIGAGAALQAIIGASLVRRFGGYPNLLRTAREVGAFLIFGGPVSCLVAATWGVGSLFVAGLVMPGNLLFSWMTWWVGDTIGVMLFGPLILLAAAPPDHPAKLWRRSAVLWPVLITTTLVIFGFIYISTVEDRRMRTEYQRAMQTTAPPPQEYLASHRSLEAWGALAGGLFFTGLLEACLLVLSGRAAQVEQMNEAMGHYVENLRHAETTLRESELRNRLILETAHDAFVAIDVDGRITAWNPHAEKIFGWPHAEAIGRALADTIIPPKYREAHLRGLAHFIDTGEGPFLNKLMELEGLHRDGHSFPVELIITPLQRGQKYYAYAFIRDITERKRSEAEAEARAEELARAEARFRLGIEAAANAMVMVDVNGRIVLVNRQSEKLFGYPREELIDKPVEILVPDRVRAEHPALRAGFFQNPEVRPMGSGRDLTARRKDGTEFSVEIGLSPFRTDTGAFVIASIVDITERKRTEAEIKAAKDAAEAANLAKSRFLANVSHELRTPLNSVIGFANVLLKNRGKNLTPENIEFTNYILENGKHLLNIINSILDLSKIEVGRFEITRTRTDLAVLVRETAETYRNQIEGKHLSLVVECRDGLEQIETDVIRLKQVVINLIGNAIKFTERGRVTIRVIETDSVPQRIEIEDTGIGIPPDKLETIFGAFQQVDASTTRKYGGTGLGLMISRAICNLLGYTLEVQSKPGAGSKFSIILSPPPVLGLPKDLSAESALIIGKPGSHLILIIDDDPAAGILLRSALEEAGFGVIAVKSGRDGIEAARTHKPDVITLDLLMPRMDGWEVLGRLKADPALAKIPVVVVSVVANENRGVLLGTVDILQKPIDSLLLIETIRRHLPTKKGKVLVVDDSDDVRLILRVCLEEEGYHVTEAANGAEALEAVAKSAPDAVVLDLMMPVMDGFTCLARLREDPHTHGLPVIIATAMELSSDETKFLATASTALLKKHGNLALELTGALHKILETTTAR